MTMTTPQCTAHLRTAGVACLLRLPSSSASSFSLCTLQPSLSPKCQSYRLSLYTSSTTCFFSRLSQSPMSLLKKFIPNSATVLNGAAGATELASLSGKIVFFYFSASWCPPCRGFTPQLIEFYNKHHETKNFEVILISWDEAQADFDGYYEKMPWLALPFADRAGMERLTKGFDVQSIPTLIGVEADTGEVITTAARNMVVKDPEAKEFPWGLTTARATETPARKIQ